MRVSNLRLDGQYLASFSYVHRWAVAVEGPQAIYAGAAIFTGMRVALVQFELAEVTRKTMPTAAREAVNSIYTRSIVQTRAMA